MLYNLEIVYLVVSLNGWAQSVMSKIKILPQNELTRRLARYEQEIEKLKAENERLKNIYNDTSDGFSFKEILALMPGNVFWKNKDGVSLGCNNNLAKFLKLNSPDDIIGKRNSDFMPEELARKLDEIDQEIMASKEGKFIEETGINANQEPAIFFSQKIPLFNKTGEVIGIVGISIDITERKKIERELKEAKEKAEASNRAKSQFLAVINHELRTPLTSILGLVNFLKKGNLSPEEEKSIVEDLDNCSQNLLNLVNDVLDFSQLEAKRYIAIITPVELKVFLLGISRILAPLAKNKNLTLKLEVDKKLPPFILTDQRLLRQILINVITNAIKYTDKGRVIIQARSIKEIGNKVTIEVVITDTGRGIPTDKINQIFEPFQQLEDPYTRQSSRSGTGLGLAIVKRLAALLNLSINVQSEVGKGTTFSLIGEFTIGNDSKAQKINSFTPKVISNIPQHKFKVLLVEDDPIVQKIHHKMLMELGATVETASSGKEALSRIKGQDILFIDIGLPDITGFQVIQKIRNELNNQHMPIIALTGYTTDKEKEIFLAAGANEVASKPINIDQIQSLLERYIKKNF